MNYPTEGEELVEYLKSPAMNLAGVVAWLRSHDAKVLREAASYYGSMIDHSRPPEDVCRLLERRASEIEAGK